MKKTRRKIDVMAPTNDRLGVRPIRRPHLCAPATPPKPWKFSICC
jgi:hypothetical protein